MLLPPTTTRCAIPKEAAGQGMLRAIAYGTELNMAYPPRPADPKIPWEPEWNLKLRVKSMTTAMLGMPEGSGMPGDSTEDMTDAPPPADGEAAPPADGKKKKKGWNPLGKKKKKGWNPLDVVKDVVDKIP